MPRSSAPVANTTPMNSADREDEQENLDGAEHFALVGRVDPPGLRVLNAVHAVYGGEQKVLDAAFEIEREDSTCLNEPATGLPAGSCLYSPEGMKKAAIHTGIRTKVRMVTGAGNPLFGFSLGRRAALLLRRRRRFAPTPAQPFCSSPCPRALACATSDGRIPNLSRNKVLKGDELLKPIEYAILVIDVWACSGDVIISQQRCRRAEPNPFRGGIPRCP